VESLLANTSAFTNELADNRQNGAAIDRQSQLSWWPRSPRRDKFSGAVDRLEKLITGFETRDRDPIGEAITALDTGPHH